MTRSSSRMIRIRTQGFSLGFFTIGRWDKVCHQSTPQRQACTVMKTCIITSHVHHSERGSVISDCLVTGSVMTSHVHHSERGSVISDCLVTGSVMTSHVHHSERGSVISDGLVLYILYGYTAYKYIECLHLLILCIQVLLV